MINWIKVRIYAIYYIAINIRKLFTIASLKLRYKELTNVELSSAYLSMIDDATIIDVAIATGISEA